MLEFRIGECVTFTPGGRGSVQGMLVRYNCKSVAVVTNDGHRWNISPSLLSSAAASDNAKHPSPPSLLDDAGVMKLQSHRFRW